MVNIEEIGSIVSLVVTATISLAIVVFSLVMLAKGGEAAAYIGAVTTILGFWAPSMGTILPGLVRKIAITPAVPPVEA